MKATYPGDPVGGVVERDRVKLVGDGRGLVGGPDDGTGLGALGALGRCVRGVADLSGPPISDTTRPKARRSYPLVRERNSVRIEIIASGPK